MVHRLRRYMDTRRDVISFSFAVPFLSESKIDRKRVKEMEAD